MRAGYTVQVRLLFLNLVIQPEVTRAGIWEGRWMETTESKHKMEPVTLRWSPSEQAGSHANLSSSPGQTYIRTWPRCRGSGSRGTAGPGGPIGQAVALFQQMRGNMCPTATPKTERSMATPSRLHARSQTKLLMGPH